MKKRLDITYSGDLYPEMDNLIKKTLNKEFIASGMLLGRHPQRDISFEFISENSVREAEKKVKKICPNAFIEINDAKN